ncbi:MAG: hypothetical protein QNK19_17270 [Xanthomonadales bacterium]|nr:hypothetical protein [Xanthomonadales bacterium]
MNRDKIHQEFIFVAGTIVSEHSIWFGCIHEAAMADGMMITQSFNFQHGNWKEGPYINMKVIDMCCNPNSGNTYLLGEDGECFDAQTGMASIIDNDDPPGPFRKIRLIGNTIMALGRESTVWKKENSDWSIFFEGASETDAATWLASSEDKDDGLDQLIDDSVVLFSIAGESSKNLCLVGTDGKIIVCKNGAWSNEEAPTNVNLYDVCSTEEGKYLACGQGGLVLSGYQGMWKISLSEVSLGDLVSIAQFGDYYYLANGQQLFRTDLKEFAVVDFGVEANVPSRSVVTSDHHILSIAGKEVFISEDGMHWDSILA